MEWTQLQTNSCQLLGARSSHGVSSHNNKLYVLGGEIIARNPVDSTLYSLSLDATTIQNWTAIETTTKNAPSPRIAHTQTIVNNTLYLFGGRQGITMEESPLNDLWTFDFDSSTWNEIATENAPEPRSFHKMISVGTNLIYVFGGCAAVGRLNDLYQYNIIENKWTKLAAAPEDLPGRGGAGFVANTNGTLLYVVGGFYGQESNGVWQYNVASNTWTTVLQEGNDQLRPFSVSVGVTLSNNKLIFFGGEIDPSEKGHEGAGGFTNDVVCLDGNTGLPLEVNMQTDVRPEARGWSDAAVWNDTVVVFGGLAGSDDDPKRLDDVWMLKC